MVNTPDITLSEARPARLRASRRTRPSARRARSRASDRTSRSRSTPASARALQIAYQTYGTLNADKSNAVLICHALTGDQHVANTHPGHRQAGLVVAHGRARASRSTPTATSSSAPTSSAAAWGRPVRRRPIPTTGKPYGLDLPVITIARHGAGAGDAPRPARHRHAASPCSAARMGGMQVLQWAASYPERVFSAVPIAAGARHSSQNIAFHEVGRQAIMADPDWRGGRYLVEGTNPRKGLAVARMAAHITYMSDRSLHREIRPQSAGPRPADLRLRRRLPDRVLSPPPGDDASSSASTRTPIST